MSTEPNDMLPLHHTVFTRTSLENQPHRGGYLQSDSGVRNPHKSQLLPRKQAQLETSKTSEGYGKWVNAKRIKPLGLFSLKKRKKWVT